MEATKYEKVVRKVGITTILWNFILSACKIIGGILAKSSSLISDGIHSASDVLSTVVVMVGAKMSKKAPDKDHPFGHERMESIASILLAFLLAITALLLGYSGIQSIISYCKGEKNIAVSYMTYIALGFAVASIIIKGWMYFYTIHAAKEINSSGLKADAFHHLTDSLSSIGSVLGIVGLLVGGNWGILDPIACVIISLCILKVSFDIAMDAINQVVDKAAPEEFENAVREEASSIEGVERINSLKTRIFGNMYYVEIEIAVKDNLTVLEGHHIAKMIHDTIEMNHGDIKHCMIHVDPISEKPEQ